MEEANSPLNDEVRRIWDANSAWWDERLGEGDPYQCELIEPSTLRLLEPGPGQTILDVACGAGRMARLMAARGARVVAVDFSERFLERARARGGSDGAPIEYRRVDATSQEQLSALGAGRFHGAVATMALMDMARIDPLFAALETLLVPGGRFVFSLLHPCFTGPGAGTFAEEVTEEHRSRTILGVKVRRYRNSEVYRAEGIRGQPEPQVYFHRSLETLFRVAFRHTFQLDGLEEPGFAQASGSSPLSWRANPELPPILVARTRLRGGPA